MSSEAEQAIIEAEHAYRPSPDTHTELGFLMMDERPIHGAQEFEDALDEDGDHLKATLGLGQLVLRHSESTKKNGEFFVSSTDELAALARLRTLLETQVSAGEGRTSSEAWWLLGCFYEKNGRTENAQKAFWRSVELEEARGVREYKCATDATSL